MEEKPWFAHYDEGVPRTLARHTHHGRCLIILDAMWQRWILLFGTLGLWLGGCSSGLLPHTTSTARELV
jgi:hypothetical protein